MMIFNTVKVLLLRHMCVPFPTPNHGYLLAKVRTVHVIKIRNGVSGVVQRVKPKLQSLQLMRCYHNIRWQVLILLCTESCLQGADPLILSHLLLHRLLSHRPLWKKYLLLRISHKECFHVRRLATESAENGVKRTPWHLLRHPYLRRLQILSNQRI